MAAAGVDDVAGLDAVAAAVIGFYLEQRLARIFLLDLQYLLPLAGIGAAVTRMVVEHFVGLLPPHLIRMRRTVADGPRKGVVVAAALNVRLRTGAGPEYAER